jgi:hypothetical protein
MNTMKDYLEIEKYLDNLNILNQFVDFAQARGVKPNQADLAISRFIIETQLKAYVARGIIDDLGFYPIITRIDNTLLRTIEILQQDNMLGIVSDKSTSNLTASGLKFAAAKKHFVKDVMAINA